VDARGDIYSLAATLYEVVTGAAPWPVEVAKLPAPLRPVLRKALEADPERRYASAEELEAALGNIAVTLASAPAAPVAVSAQPSVCPHCGRENRARVEFCGGCGFDLKQAGAVAERLASGRAALARGAWEAALGEFEAALALAPEHGEARSAADSMRQMLARIAGLRTRANALAMRGALREAGSAWRELLALVPRDPEALAQMAKCEEQLDAQQLGGKLGAARTQLKRHRFQPAADACREVLQLDPGNAEAKALLEAIPQSQVLWLRSSMKRAVRAYQARDFAQAYERFSSAYREAESCATPADLQKLAEGMELSRLAPALEGLYATGRPDGEVLAWLDGLASEYATPRAREIIAAARVEVEQRYLAQAAAEARAAASARARVAAARRRRITQVVLAGAGVVLLWVGGGYALRQIRLARLPDAIRGACDGHDYDEAIKQLREYVELGGRTQPGLASAEETLATELARRLRDDATADHVDWAAPLAALQGRSADELVRGVGEQNFAAALEGGRWRQAAAALDQMGRLPGAAGDQQAELTQRVGALAEALERAAAPSEPPTSREDARQAIDRILDNQHGVARFVTPATEVRLRRLQLEAAFALGAYASGADYAAALDRVGTSGREGGEQMRAYLERLRAVAAAAAQESDFARAAAVLEVASHCTGAAKSAKGEPQHVRRTWESVLQQALDQQRWPEARSFADRFDNAYRDESPGRKVLESRGPELLKQADASVRARDYAAAQRAMLGALQLRCPVGDVTALIKRAIEEAAGTQAWDSLFELVTELERAEPGRTVGKQGFEALFDKALRRRDAAQVGRCVDALDRLDPGTGRARLEGKLGVDVLREANRSIERDKPREAVSKLADWAPILALSQTEWPRFCRERGAGLAAAAKDALAEAEQKDDTVLRAQLGVLSQLLSACAGG
jgi:tetratricopeptide (TPR) repeat protein